MTEFEDLDLVIVTGRYGDEWGPIPFGLINPACLEGSAFHGSLDIKEVMRARDG
jgi:hypothetical protein